jgi:hydroxyacylglutathione hydrolase
MYFKQLLNERCGCASYVIASRRTHDAAIIDPALDTEPYDALLSERDFRLQYVIDTHIHADHVSGARRLAARSSKANGPTQAETVTQSSRKKNTRKAIRNGLIRNGFCRIASCHILLGNPESEK